METKRKLSYHDATDGPIEQHNCSPITGTFSRVVEQSAPSPGVGCDQIYDTECATIWN